MELLKFSSKLRFVEWNLKIVEVKKLFKFWSKPRFFVGTLELARGAATLRDHSLSGHLFCPAEHPTSEITASWNTWIVPRIGKLRWDQNLLGHLICPANRLRRSIWLRWSPFFSLVGVIGFLDGRFDWDAWAQILVATRFVCRNLKMIENMQGWNFGREPDLFVETSKWSKTCKAEILVATQFSLPQFQNDRNHAWAELLVATKVSSPKSQNYQNQAWAQILVATQFCWPLFQKDRNHAWAEILVAIKTCWPDWAEIQIDRNYAWAQILVATQICWPKSQNDLNLTRTYILAETEAHVWNFKLIKILPELMLWFRPKFVAVNEVTACSDTQFVPRSSKCQ